MASLNNALNAAMDLIVLDMLQLGSGLPSGHTITIANGTEASAVNLPWPPGTNFTTAAGATTTPAVIPRPGAGPVINNVATDVLTVLMADNTFTNVALSAVTA